MAKSRAKGASKTAAKSGRVMTTPIRTTKAPQTKKAVTATGKTARTKGASKLAATGQKAVSGVRAATGTAVSGVVERYTGVSTAAVSQSFRGAGAARGYGKRRRGAVPKTVKKWLSKTDRKMKAIEKAAKSFRKIINRYAPKSKHRDSSEGVITRKEADRALRS